MDLNWIEVPALRRYAVRIGLPLLAGVWLFGWYLTLTRSMPVNADGSSNALQAWDMLHGNVLLRGWTLSDVPFYTTELIEYALVILVVGLRPDVIWVASAITYTLVVLLAAAVAKGEATGRSAVVRVGVTVAILLLPAPVSGFTVLLMSPDHTGTAVPLLVTWLVLERARARRWLPLAVGALLVWAQLGDPLALFVGAAPVVGVSLLRLLRDPAPWGTRWKGTDARLAAAGLASVLLTHLALLLVYLAGGFLLHQPTAQFSSPGKWFGHLGMTLSTMAVNAGAYWPELHTQGPVMAIAGVLNSLGLALSLCALGYGLYRLVRYRDSGDRVADVMTLAIVINLSAFILSTQSDGDLGAARQIVVTLPFGAVLAARLLADRLFAYRPARIALAGALVMLQCGLAYQSGRAVPSQAEGTAAAQWLDAQGLRHGLGSYWASNNVTLATHGRVVVAPVTGPDRIYAYRWESNADWYDPDAHDARFVILDRDRPGYGTEAVARAQFGEPLQRHEFGQFTVLVYGHNLLRGLPAACLPDAAETISDCPRIRPGVPGAEALR